jgi:ketosteroid isomerase-like protein
MLEKFTVFCAALLLVGGIGCQQKGEAPMDQAAAKELCTRLLTEYVESIKTLDPNKCDVWFTKDAVLIYPDMPELKGRDIIRAFFVKGFPGMKVLEMTFTLIHFDVVGSKAYTFVTIDELEQEGAKPPVHALARCGVVWERQTDNSWQISHFLVNYLNL